MYAIRVFFALLRTDTLAMPSLIVHYNGKGQAYRTSSCAPARAISEKPHCTLLSTAVLPTARLQAIVAPVGLNHFDRCCQSSDTKHTLAAVLRTSTYKTICYC